MQISFLTAFLGGMLALLSPCSALLMPAFFASTVGTRMRLLAHGSVFTLGLIVTLVPLGLGLGALGSLIMSERGLIIAIASLLLVALGVLQVFGIGFDLARVLPGAGALQQQSATRSGFVRTLLLGAVSGVAGFCAGPILGAILTLAMTQGSPWMAGALLAVYGVGMVVPLMIIASLWHRLGDRGRRMLRGKSFTIMGRKFHTTSVITGTLIVIVGVIFWLTNGLVALPSLVPTDVQAWIQSRGTLLANPIIDVSAIVALTALALAIWVIRRSRATARKASADTTSDVSS